MKKRLYVAVSLLALAGCASSLTTRTVTVSPEEPYAATTIEKQKADGTWLTVSSNTTGNLHQFQDAWGGTYRIVAIHPYYKTATVPLGRDDLVVNIPMERKPGVTSYEVFEYDQAQAAKRTAKN